MSKENNLKLYKAVAFLAGRCDGAIRQDDVGFNKTDTYNGKRIVFTDPQFWSLEQSYAVWKMLRKYNRQLAMAGISFSDIEKPVNPDVEYSVKDCFDEEPRLVYLSQGHIIVSFDMDRDLIEKVKDTVKTIRWNNGVEKHWSTPIYSDIRPEIEKLRDYGFNVLPEVFDAIDRCDTCKPKTLPSKYVYTVKPQVIGFMFKFDPSLKDQLKELGCKWERNIKVWYMNLMFADYNKTKSILSWIADNGFVLQEEAKSLIENHISTLEKQFAMSKREGSLFNVDGLGGELRPFQKAGVEYAVQTKRCFIADEMGLGKTVQALATIQCAGAFPALVVCPASLKINWKREAGKWLPNRASHIINGKKDWPESNIYIINYDILKKNLKRLKGLGLQAVIFDESHYCKNYKAQRTKAAIEIAKSAPVRLALTGTPLLNRPQELLSQLQIIGRLNDLGGFWHFAKRYCAAQPSKWGWDFSGASNLSELNDRLRSICYIRRNKQEVLKELPSKNRIEVSIPINNRREYNRAESDFLSWVGEQAKLEEEFLASIKDMSESEQNEAKLARSLDATYRAAQAEHLVKIGKLRQLAAYGKIEAAKEWIRSFIESDKLVLFAHHQHVIDEIAKEFNCPTITGKDNAEARQAAVDKFMHDPTCKLIALNIKAGGVGLTLTAASNVAFLELDWTPGNLAQAEDRCHRIGQDNQVNCWYLLGHDTVDVDMYDLVEIKRTIVDQATEGDDVKNISIQQLTIDALIKRAKKTLPPVKTL